MKKSKLNKISTTLRKKRSELEHLGKQERVPAGRIAHVEKQIVRLVSLEETETCKLYS